MFGFLKSRGRRKAVIKQGATTKGLKRNTRSVNASSSSAHEIVNYEYKAEDVLRSIKKPEPFPSINIPSLVDHGDITEMNNREYYSFTTSSSTYIRRKDGNLEETIVTLPNTHRVNFATYSDFVYYSTGIGNDNISVIYDKGMFLKVDDVSNYQVNYTVENGSGAVAIVEYVDFDLNVLVIGELISGSFSDGDTVSQPAIPDTSAITTGGEVYHYELPEAPSADFIETMSANGDSRLIAFNTITYGVGTTMRSHTDKNYGIPFDNFDFTAGAEALDEGGLTISSDLKRITSAGYVGGNVFQFNENGLAVWNIGAKDEYGIGAVQDFNLVYEEKNTDVFYASSVTKDGVYYTSETGVYLLNIISVNKAEHILVSKDISNLMEDISLVKSSMAVFDNKLYISCIRGEYNDNNYILIYDLQYGRWTTMVQPYAKLYSNKKNLYGFATGPVNRMETLFEGEGYLPTILTFKEEDLGLPRYSKSLRDIHVECLISNDEITHVTVDYWKDNNTKLEEVVDLELIGDGTVQTYDKNIHSKPYRKFQIEVYNLSETYNEFHYLESEVEVYDKIYKNNV